MKGLKSKKQERQNDSPAVSVDKLTKVYGNGAEEVTAIDGVSFDVSRGSIVGLLGPNGAGKTTTIKSMLGLIIPDSGQVSINGIDVHDNPREAYEHVGVMFEGARNEYWRLSVRQNLEFFTALGGNDPEKAHDRHEELLKRFGIADEADTTVNELSRGMKQKVSLASTLARDTSVVFLDEPTLGLDVETSIQLRQELRRLAKEEGMTVLLSSHNMDVIHDVCDRVIILKDGEVIVDRAVDDLLNMLNTQSYQITIQGAVPPELQTDLNEKIGVHDWAEFNDKVRFRTMVEGNEFYSLINTLEQYDCTLDNVTSTDDLEDVFLKVTGA